MNLLLCRRLAALGLLAVAAAAQQAPQDDAPLLNTTGPAKAEQVDAAAKRVVRQMSDHLAKLKRFRFDIHVLYDLVEPDGQKIQLGRHSQVMVSRPDGLSVESKGDRGWDKRIAYDGRHFLIHDRKARVCSRVSVPETLDQLFDHLFDEYGITAPLSEFLLSDPYSALLASVQRGTLLGDALVGDSACHHLAFSQEDLDWQLWVEKGDQPWPRKLVITYKDVDVRPQFQAVLSDWRSLAEVSRSTFDTEAPAGAEVVPMEKRQEATTRPRRDDTVEEK